MRCCTASWAKGQGKAPPLSHLVRDRWKLGNEGNAVWSLPFGKESAEDTRTHVSWRGPEGGAFIFPRFPPSERASTPGKLPPVKAAPPVHITLMNKMQQARLEQHDQNSSLLSHLGGKWTNNLGNRGWGWSTGSPEDFLAKWSFSILLSPKQLYPVMWGGHKSLLPPMTPKSKGAAKRGFR